MIDPLLWIWLAQACSPGSDAWGILRDAGHTPLSLRAAGREELTALIPRRRALIERLLDRDTTAASRILAVCAERGVAVVPYDAPGYPAALRELRDPPAVLYVCGRLPTDGVPAVSLVGTRTPSAYGARVAYSAARDLASASVTVVSGLALGVDACAHAGALRADGVTVAFVACGPDVVYPASHRRLYEALLRRGAVVGEYPPGTTAVRHHFPARNRLVSGYARATVLVEGARDSGSLITARRALSQARPTYAVPGRLDDPRGAASTLLLSEGARPYLSAAALLRDLGLTDREPLAFSDGPADVASHLRALGVALSRPDGAAAPGRLPPPGRAPSRTPVARQTYPSAPPPYRDPDLFERAFAPAPPPASEPDLSALGEAERRIWERIPATGAAHQDDLAGEDDARRVLCALTVLEASGLILRLPGGYVCRRDDASDPAGR